MGLENASRNNNVGVPNSNATPSQKKSNTSGNKSCDVRR